MFHSKRSEQISSSRFAEKSINVTKIGEDAGFCQKIGYEFMKLVTGFSIVVITLSTLANAQQAPKRCFLKGEHFGPTHVALYYGDSYDTSQRRGTFDEVDDLKDANNLIDGLKKLQDQGLCSKDANAEICYLDQGYIFTGISVKSADGQNTRNIMYSLGRIDWAGARTMLEKMKAAGICNSIQD